MATILKEGTGGANPGAYRNYLLAVLLVVLAFSQVDRVALGVVLQSIKLDLALSDTQLGLLTGIAFTLFYSVVGIPLARWADRGNRITIIATTTALWSAAVAMCGFAGSFLQLLMVRVVVAVGEAGCIPPAQSLIADYFTRAERPRATSRYMLGYPLSAVVAYFLAGWLNEHYGWRVTFIVLGLPGLALALLAWLTLREPRLRSEASSAASELHGARNAGDPDQRPAHPTLREVYATLWASATFRHLLLAWSIMLFFGYGTAQWKPAFFIRSFGLQTGEVGTWFAVIYGLSGLLGMYWGGEWSARRAARNESLQLKAMAFAFVAFGALSAGIYLSTNLYLAFALLALSLLGIYMTYGPLFATIQTLVEPRMRAVALATIYLVANLIGMGLGPLAAGALSDALRPSFGGESLRYALLTLCPGYLWAAWHLWRGSATVASDLLAIRDDAGADRQHGSLRDA